MKKTYKNILVLVTLIIVFILILINSTYIINNFLDYSKLFLTKLFPVSFIFFIFSYIFIEYGFVDIIMYYFNINICGLYVFILSLISGFPSGSKYTKDLLNKNLITEKEANKIILYSHFPNPLFVLGSVYLVLDDYSISLKILISMILSNFIIFIFNIDRSNKKKTYTVTKDSFSTILSKAIYDSFKVIILIYGTSIFFYLISSIITKYIFLSNYQFVLLSGLFDLTKGVFSTSLINNTIIKAYFILFFISFGSISIHMQVCSILNNTSISYKRFLIGRIIGTILAIILFSILLICPF